MYRRLLETDETESGFEFRIRRGWGRGQPSAWGEELACGGGAGGWAREWTWCGSISRLATGAAAAAAADEPTREGANQRVPRISKSGCFGSNS